jgi:hypothetical protein
MLGNTLLLLFRPVSDGSKYLFLSIRLKEFFRISGRPLLAKPNSPQTGPINGIEVQPSGKLRPLTYRAASRWLMSG